MLISTKIWVCIKNMTEKPADLFGEITSINFLTNNISVYKSYTLSEKQAWLTDILTKTQSKKKKLILLIYRGFYKQSK